MPETHPERTFVPEDLDPAQWSQLEPLFQALLEQEIDSPADLRQWLADFSELMSVVSEFGTRRRVDQACHTDDPEIEKAFLHWVDEIAPKVKPLHFELQKKMLASPHKDALAKERFAILIREWQADVEIFRDENVPLQTQVTRKVSEYDKLIGAMEVEFRGETYTLQQMARFLDHPDRETREEAWRLSAERRLKDREAIDAIFDEVRGLRRQIAHNADLPDYRAYAWKAYGRFDYTPDDCIAFQDAVAEVCVPLVEALDRERRATLGLDALRPWDLAVDKKGRPPLRPFDADHPTELVDKTREVFRRVSPGLADDFAHLRVGRNLDLESRRGKRGGGFQASLEESGEPFIFMNAAGVQRDVETMLHEGGHAFHFMWACQNEPLVFLRHSPMEFAEVASMSMELIGSHQLDVFYEDEEQLARARRAMLESTVRIFPWIATIDAFQHWIYTHPGHTEPQRREHWRQLMDRFSSSEVDWAGLEDARSWLWHRQLHLFHHPFYYIEYGIAQLGALQMWAQYQTDSDAALGRYRRALSLGGTRKLPELFEAAGLRFDFSRATLEPLMQQLGKEIAKLPD